MARKILYPSQVILEVTTACNLQCKGCAIHGPERCVTRPMGNMKKEVWQKAISEIGSWERPVNLTTHGGGKPLLHPALKDILNFALLFPQIRVGFLTNGMLLDSGWANFIVSKDVDWIAFSVDGVNPKTHAVVRKGSNLSLIENNISQLLSLREKNGGQNPRVILNMVAYDEVMDQRTAFLERWLPQVDSVIISHYRNPPSSERWPGVTSKRRPCFLLWSQAVIAWDGRMGLCCEDFDIEIEIDKVETDSILESWNGRLINSIRDAHLKGHVDSLDLCKDCDSWADEIVREEIHNQKNYKVLCRASQEEYQQLR